MKFNKMGTPLIIHFTMVMQKGIFYHYQKIGPVNNINHYIIHIKINY
jgi:hypothetical protein